jgi:hypothetical protein
MAHGSAPEEYEGVELRAMLMFLMELIDQATAAKASYGQLIACDRRALHLPEGEGDVPSEYAGDIDRFFARTEIEDGPYLRGRAERPHVGCTDFGSITPLKFSVGREKYGSSIRSATFFDNMSSLGLKFPTCLAKER